VVSITTGFGATTSIVYKPLTDSAVYTKATSSTYPQIDLQMPMYVVSSVSSSNGIGGTVTTNYKYGGLKAELGTGRGLLGFAWTEMTNVETGITVRTDYRQDWPFTGLPSQVKKTLAGGGGNNGVLSIVSSSYDCFMPRLGGGAACAVSTGDRYFPYASQNVETSWDLTGAALPTVTTTNQFDPYGNATQITVSTGDGYSKTTTNTYANDVVNWYLGRLLRSTVTSTTP
jgi:hypothetical protein